VLERLGHQRVRKVHPLVCLQAIRRRIKREPWGQFLKKSRHKFAPTRCEGADWAWLQHCLGTKLSVGATWCLASFKKLPSGVNLW
jgi:hypothetical protein